MYTLSGLSISAGISSAPTLVIAKENKEYTQD